MTLQLGDIAPDFTQDSSAGTINFHDWAGDSWVVLFSHPADYTPVCTTELGEVAKLKGEFEKRNAKVIALSVDDSDSHKGWIGDIEETQGTAINYPILADADRKVSDLYGMIHPKADAKVTVRTVFVIDKEGNISYINMEYSAGNPEDFEALQQHLISLSGSGSIQ